MTLEIVILLVILAGALVLFTFEWVSPDVTALGVMLSLIVTGLLSPEQAFAGFGSDTVMMFLGLLILTAALLRTGVVEMAGRAVLRRAGKDPNRLLILVVLAVALLSAFMSNTAATAFFLPITLGVAARARVSPSRLLLPLAFASILTSSVTLVSTSTNIVVSGVMTRYGLEPMGMFELSPVGIPIAVVGLVYVLTLGRRLLPERARGAAEDLTEGFGLGSYLTEVLILPASSLIGKTLAQSGLGRDLDLTVVRVLRGKDHYLLPRAETLLEAGDVLLVEGAREDVLRVKDTAGIDIKADVKFASPDLQAGDSQLVEVILLPRSALLGNTLKEYRFRELHGPQVLAVNRHGETLRSKLSDVRLGLGDVLLVQGSRADLANLQGSGVARIIGEVDENRPKLRHAPAAILIFVAALAAATFKIVALPVAVLLGALLAFVTRCITPEEAYREVEWKALILVGSMLALGAAMEVTGAAKFLAAEVVGLLGGGNPVWLLAAFFVLTVILTQPMSNQAAAVVVVPVAIQTALQLDLNPRTFAMMIAVAASCSYLTPLEPSCLMVYGPGRYRFVDFLKVGALLTILIFALACLLVPLVWPL
ncbi:MAG: SLC13 family permease [Gemmatimonadetes bacterium]|nr:SLC13 family permease [Gemmatimonadota bacterium]